MVFVLGIVFAAGLEAGPPSETLLPNTTKAFVSIADVTKLTDQINKTQLGQLRKDPAMEPFVKDLRRQFEDRWTGIQEKLGLTLDDLKDVPGGELAVAMLLPDDKQPAVAVLVDITGHQPQAEAMLAKIGANLVRQGAKQSQLELEGTPVTVFDLPEKDDRQPRALYSVKSDLLVASDHLEVMRAILGRLAGKPGQSLADVPAFQAVMKRCQDDAGAVKPQVRWFIEPLGYADAVWAATPERYRPKGKNKIDAVRNAGFTMVHGVGGFADVAPQGFELLYRAFAYAPGPAEKFEKSGKMLVFPNHAEFAPQPWVPRDIATYTTMYCDILNAFDHFGPLYDELVGGGEQGMWDETLRGLKLQGPKIDLREEIIAHLGQRVTAISDYQLPITTTSERLLFAIEAEDEKALAAGIEKLFKNDKEVVRRVYKDRVIWEMVPEQSDVPEVKVNVSGVGEDQPAEDEEDEALLGQETPPLLPHMAVTVAEGNLFVASHIEFLIKVLDLAEARETLARNPDFLLVDETTATLGGSMACGHTFSLTDEQYRPTYELIRQGKMPESQTMLGRLLNAVFAAATKEKVRKQQIDGSKLPDFEVVRRHLGPAGCFVASEENGWFVKGFTLPKK